MGALETFDGMLLFSVSTTYIFSVMQVYWSMLTTHVIFSAVMCLVLVSHTQKPDKLPSGRTALPRRSPSLRLSKQPSTARRHWVDNSLACEASKLPNHLGWRLR